MNSEESKNEVIRVGLADYKICQAPGCISTLGLGSCMGVVIYNENIRLCGMAHIMLPDSSKSPRGDNRRKYADTCLEDMYQELLKEAGTHHQHFHAKIAGGAKMFHHTPESKMLNIGEQNQRAVRKFLKNHQIPIVAEDVGKDFGRTITFDPAHSTLHVSAVGIADYII